MSVNSMAEYYLVNFIDNLTLSECRGLYHTLTTGKPLDDTMPNDPEFIVSEIVDLLERKLKHDR